MASACIVNVDNHGLTLLKKLEAEGKIKRYGNVVGSPRWCFEFTGELLIDFSDYIELIPDRMLNKSIVMDTLRDQFKKHVVQEIVNTLKGGVVKDFTSDYIVMESTDRTEIITVRVTRKEKDKLKQEAQKQGVSLSDYIRGRLGL